MTSFYLTLKLALTCFYLFCMAMVILPMFRYLKKQYKARGEQEKYAKTLFAQMCILITFVLIVAGGILYFLKTLNAY